MQLTAIATIFTVLSAALAAPAPAPEAQPIDIPVEIISSGETLETRQSGVARVQFELEAQTTFIQRNINVPGSLNLNQGVVAATIVSVSGGIRAVCQAFNANGGAIGGQIRLNQNTVLSGGRRVQVARVQCNRA